MHRTWMGILCICIVLCSALPARADVGPEARNRMSFVLTLLTSNRLSSVQIKELTDQKNLSRLLSFAAFYVEAMHSYSKVRLSPALLKSGGTAPLGELIVPLDAVKNVIKRFFDYDLPELTPNTHYDSVYFDGKDLHIRMASGGTSYLSVVKEAKVLNTGNIFVKGVMRTDSEPDTPFTAELKPILWKNLKSYAVVSLTPVQKGE